MALFSNTLSLSPLQTSLPKITRSPSLPYLTLNLTNHRSYLSSRLYGTTIKVIVPRAVTDKIVVEPVTSGGSGGGGGDFGGGGGGGKGGGGGGGEGDGEEEEESGKESKKMSMSQKLTLGYAFLVGVGGLMGYIKGGSQKSLAAGGFSAILLYYVYTQLPHNPTFASSIGMGLSAALLVVMGSRFKKSGKVFPAGVVSLVSLIMTGGYLHGIMRGMH